MKARSFWIKLRSMRRAVDRLAMWVDCLEATHPLPQVVLTSLRSVISRAVLDTYSPAQGLIVHKVKVEKGTLKVGDTVTAEVDVEKRDATRRNHTATHLMHAALREVLGTHVKQAGSVVAPTYLRFDFTHYQPLTQSEIEEIERLVNYHILRNEPVQTDEMAVEEAMRSGAMALFGEKYGEKVRVLSIKGRGRRYFLQRALRRHTRARHRRHWPVQDHQ